LPIARDVLAIARRADGRVPSELSIATLDIFRLSLCVAGRTNQLGRSASSRSCRGKPLRPKNPAFVPLVAAQDDRQGITVTSVSVLIILGSAPAARRPSRAGIPRIG
jgi:hypothetical protein